MKPLSHSRTFPIESLVMIVDAPWHVPNTNVDDIQMTTTLIRLDLQMVHHFIEGTGIDTTDVNATTFLVLLVLVLFNSLYYCDEVEVNLRPTVSRPVCLDVRRPSGTRDQFFFLIEISFRQLRVCYFVAPSLTRGRVCNLLYNYFWALPEQSLSGRSPAEPRPYFTAHLRLPQPGGPGSRIYIPLEQDGPVIPPGTGFLLCRLLRLAGQRWKYSNPPPHGVRCVWSWSSSCGRQSVDQCVWVSGLHLGPLTRFYLALLFSV
jgi:hypothetical protein